jgi:hypothetical protein
MSEARRSLSLSAIARRRVERAQARSGAIATSGLAQLGKLRYCDEIGQIRIGHLVEAVTEAGNRENGDAALRHRENPNQHKPSKTEIATPLLRTLWLR